MTAGQESAAEKATRERTVTLVWIDSREAFVVRWLHGEAKVEHLESDVPVHHRTTGHVRHDASRAGGGGGVPQASVEARRLEHLARFVADVADLVPSADEVVLLGPGTVREHLANQIEQLDARHHRARPVACRAARPLTVPQLVALLRSEIGAEPPRKQVRRRRRLFHRPSRQEEREYIALSAEED